MSSSGSTRGVAGRSVVVACSSRVLPCRSTTSLTGAPGPTLETASWRRYVEATWRPLMP